MIEAVLSSGLAAAGIRAELRLPNVTMWDEVLRRLSFIPVAYSQSELDYQLSYLRGVGMVCQDISLILYHDNRPCGVWPLYYTLHNSRAALSSYLQYGLPMLPPLLVAGLADKTKKNVTKKCLDLVDGICGELNIQSWHSAESYIEEVGLSHWYEQSLQRGATTSLAHESFVDLTLDMISIKAKFRKSYKSLVTEGMRIWSVGVLSEANPELWESFRLLHQRVAGRTTRPIETWNLQYQAILKEQAFLVHLHNAEGELVGGGYFAITRDQGVYNVGAYDRALFGQPLGHVVQYKAIEEMKARGLRWYKIGLARYRSQDEGVTDKLAAIGEFMQGFASHLFPRYVIQRNVETINHE